MGKIKVDTRTRRSNLKRIPKGGHLRRSAYWASRENPIYGHKAISRDGYLYRWIYKRGYIAEHRLVAENALGRELKRSEVVHHIDGNKRNNDPSNLLVCKQKYHEWLHRECLRVYGTWHLRSA